MIKSGSKLSAAFVRAVAKTGKYYDTNGLILRVMPSGSKQWVQRLVIHGKRRDIGLGGYPLVTLAEARQQTFDNRKLARAGGDPLALKCRPEVPTFEEAVDTVIELHAATWKDSGKSSKQWRASLRDYAMPRLGRRRIDTITSADVMAVLLPIWNDKHETARRVRQRIGAVCKWAIAQGYRKDNPAGEAIGAALPKSNGVQKHHRALPYAEVGAAVAKVRESGASTAVKLCFEFLVLTACRSGEIRFARWDEIDLAAAAWTIPAERMKAKREHRVPLSDRAVEVLQQAREIADGSGLVFPTPTGKALSDSTLSKLIRELCVAAVPHGFRSSFRDWCSECSNVPREVAEAVLAHVVRNKAEAAYARSDLFERRRGLMDDWAAYLSPTTGRVVPMARRHG